MAKARALIKRRKSIRDIRKITRTMELIATARFKRAMDRALAASDYTRRITELVEHLSAVGSAADHPLLQPRAEPKRVILLVLTANRGLCGGFNGGVMRLALARREQLLEEVPRLDLEVSGKRGISACRFRKIPVAEQFTHFEEKPRFEEAQVLAERYLEEFRAGELDRLEVAYTRFENLSRQEAAVETLLPLAAPGTDEQQSAEPRASEEYEFLPSTESILEELLPTSFKVRLFKCFLDSAVSEQIARMVAMKAATENADGMIRHLTLAYNRARQGQITGELLEIMGGSEALK